jgi:hypothetical protein
MIDKVLQVFEGERRGERSATKGFEKLVETVSPEAYNDVVFRRNIAERSRDGGRERDLEEIVTDLRKSVR